MTQATPSRLPPATVERWKAIVLKAARAGADISQLVQHFAEQSFQNKVVLLEGQGVHRRALTNMRQVVLREVDRAALASRGATKKDGTLLRGYEASRFDFRPPTAKDPSAPPDRKVSIKDVPMGFSGDDHGCTIVPLKPLLTTPEQVRRYEAQLHEQMAKIDLDISAIDAVLNQGVRNHKAVVDDLAATSKELYALALQVVAELPPAVNASAALRPLPLDNTLTYAGTEGSKAGTAGPGSQQGADGKLAADDAPSAAAPAATPPADTPADAARAAMRNLWSRVTKKGS